MRSQRSNYGTFHKAYKDFNEYKKAIERSIIPPNILLLSFDGSVLLSIPEWKGFSKFFYLREDRLLDHFAHWENFYIGGKVVYIILEIDWSNGESLRLGFIYPDYREILDHIWESRAVGLLDKPLRNGFIDPESKCLVVKNLPLWSIGIV